ncbi:MAG: hypothetical protein L6Q83_11250, partial [Gammaproteobacteria bacterium]|nr:hypothetical protein [Gammaproteobacteria bacterium]
EATPLRRTLGPTLTRVTAGGNVATSLRLTLPIKNLDDYRLDVLFDARDCRLGLQRLPIDLKNLRGRVHLQNTRLSGDGLQAIMLGEPVRIRLSPQPAGEPYSHVVEFTGSTPVARVTSTFSLPLREYFDGQLGWSAAVRIPSPGEAVRQPLTVAVRSRLEGVASALPVPLRKDAAAIWPTELELRFPEDEIIDVTGRLTPPFSWALRLASTPDGWSVERGQLRAGPGEAGLPDEAGMEVVGAVADLRLGDWLDLGGGEGRQPQETYRNLELQIGQLATVGYMFPEVAVVARREAAEWSVVVRGPTVEGELSVPFDTETAPLRLDLTRLWLLEPEPGDSGGPLDPRNAPAFELRAADTILGDWRLGQVEMNVERVPDGLVARRIATRASSFGIDAEGAWRVMADDVQRQSSGIRATLKGNDVAATLQDLGFEPVMTGKKVGMKVDLSWPGSPGANIRSSASGRIEVDFEKGQVTNVEPGGGRILGLLSITALPRRLSLDFRDVFKEGLGFDSIKGDFGVESGVAYTCNLGLSGPAANIAVIGRTDLGGRLYDQLAVVRPEVSSMLAMGGAVLGGPVGGVTMLLISQIFSKPISTLGESYYRVTGGWDDPTVKRVQRGEVDADAFKDCERELAETLKAIEAAARANETIQSAPEEPR